MEQIREFRVRILGIFWRVCERACFRAAQRDGLGRKFPCATTTKYTLSLTQFYVLF